MLDRFVWKAISAKSKIETSLDALFNVTVLALPFKKVVERVLRRYYYSMLYGLDREGNPSDAKTKFHN